MGWSAAAAALVLTVLAGCTPEPTQAALPPRGGGPYLAWPTTRSDPGNFDFNWNGRFDAGGRDVVRNNTPNDVWPSRDSAYTAARYGYCGGVAGSVPDFLTPETVSATLTPGQTLNMTFITDEDTPPGHVVFSICDRATNVSQECFNEHLLRRVEDGNLIDFSWDERFFVKPGFGVYHPTFHMPEQLTCSHCVLQWHFVGAGECLPHGYVSFGFPAEYGIDKNKPACGDVFPEEFWGCADIALLPQDNPQGLPCDDEDQSGCMVVLGYFASWSYHRPAPYTFMIEHIDAGKYTHLAYAFAGIDADYTIMPGEAVDVDGGRYALFHTHVRQRNPNIKTLLSVGGYTFNADSRTQYRFSTMVASQQRRATFIASLIPFLRTHDFDGVDIDWEFPGYLQNGGSPQDRDNFLTFLQELRQAVNSEVTQKDALIVTVAVSAYRGIAEQAYHIREMHKYIDFINLLSYDLHGYWEPQTGAHTALSSTDGIDVQDSVAFWLEQGTPRQKLLLGFGTHARGWTLDSPANHAIGAPASSPSRPGPYTDEAGLLAYYEVLEFEQAGFITRFDNLTQTMYTYYGDQWFSHDSPFTIKLKAEFALSQGLGGAMVWSIDQDDFLYGSPLVQAIRDNLPISPPPPPASDGDPPLNLTEIIIIAVVGVLALIAFVVLFASCNKHALSSKPTLDNSGVGAEYDTPVPVIPVLKLSEDDLESETSTDDSSNGTDGLPRRRRRLKPRYYDLGEMEDEEDPMQKAEDYVTTKDGVLVDTDGRMVARFHDGEHDEIYDYDQRRRRETDAAHRRAQAELVAMRNGKYVARHYDDEDITV
ncbi:oviductal secretory glycoprotein [Salpingoeca rosetta]|uniref:Oviductal secretory glycoprotein n=1 Tax=Salpingoeca rosetta (strain ATCC 50818 / BSB-021) TaxID=946362 RepID=F2U099_SALR5|nr:oviductal secretory glycoprotein [Salpingoeca rosetta]EGD80827.1 oviductal secretory glycoprotein [Salpingoeca rosetta]|eukprot:XP_004997388.1 oviductal secretory glycoprotein [Salpingoeca rosetta]